MLLDIVSIVDDGVHTGDLLLGHLSMLLDIVSIVDDGAHTGDLLLGHLSVLISNNIERER
jgi:predicted phosphoribosyltransferase